METRIKYVGASLPPRMVIRCISSRDTNCHKEAWQETRRLLPRDDARLRHFATRCGHSPAHLQQAVGGRPRPVVCRSSVILDICSERSVPPPIGSHLVTSEARITTIKESKEIIERLKRRQSHDRQHVAICDGRHRASTLLRLAHLLERVLHIPSQSPRV